MKIFYASRRIPGIATAARHVSWCSWPPLLWAVATVSSPTIWIVLLMLRSDARCDQPLFWWGLGPAVALSHALAIWSWRPDAWRSRRRAGMSYLGTALPATILLVLLLAWCSGFLHDMLPLAERWTGRAEAWASLGCGAAIIVAFALMSHLPSAAVLPSLAFRGAAPRTPAPG
ncbi:hypothetical protein [Herbaspirillum sp. alder98]|uniref:hypothetical protein n=1 Tax=Herbaspirillum sp. alder98 TaxID=2913096 RepID=UPI001CD8ED8B|nr:hypothetical protein [Herbaspirillum sp. alder98]MCA1325593.1 hypothetical protein [Herbaspirillum sp. alder98]